MRVILFGATGMIGSGVLLECLDDPRIVSVLSVVRQSGGIKHTKLHELVHDDFVDYTSIDVEFAEGRRVFLLPRRFIGRHARGGLSQGHVRLHARCS